MKSLNNPAVNDAIKPDYQIFWFNPLSSEQGKCTIFTYGRGKKMAIATFQILYPGYCINKMIEIKTKTIKK